jgi:protoheme IX farnesyltransferase
MTGSKSNKRFMNYLRLSKLRIMLPVSLTGFTGYFLFKPSISGGILLVTLGIFLVAIAASVLNQLQEKDIDSKMKRTRNRPLPSGNISDPEALAFSLLCLISGMVIIWMAGNPEAALLALFTVIWYNAVYTGLKKITAFAVIPGAITGAVPPVIGWIAAGGNPTDKILISLSALLFFGQIPHFWLVMLKYNDEYKEAGIPVLTDLFSLKKVNSVIFLSVTFTALAALALCYFEIISTIYLNVTLILATVMLLWRFSGLFGVNVNHETTGKYSRLLDLYFLLILLLLISEKIISL